MSFLSALFAACGTRSGRPEVWRSGVLSLRSWLVCIGEGDSRSLWVDSFLEKRSIEERAVMLYFRGSFLPFHTWITATGRKECMP